jgi:putative lipoprotein
VALVAVSGCGRPAAQQARPTDESGPPAGGAVTLFYDCDGRNFTVRVHADTASVMVPDKTFVLLRVPAASGAKYSDGATTFWNKGDEATLTVAGRTYSGCRRIASP